MHAKFEEALTLAKTLAREYNKIMVVFKHHEDVEVVCQDTYVALFEIHGLECLAKVAPSGRIIQ